MKEFRARLRQFERAADEVRKAASRLRRETRPTRTFKGVEYS